MQTVRHARQVGIEQFSRKPIADFREALLEGPEDQQVDQHDHAKRQYEKRYLLDLHRVFARL